MTIIPCPHTNERAIFACAQAGCERCLEYLVERNKGLIHAVVRKARIGGVLYQEVVEEGRIGLWEAIKGYDPMRGTAFSTYAWWKIWGEVWKYARAFSQKGERWEEEPYEAFDAEMAEASWEQKQIAEFVKEALALLPERLRQILERAYGLGDEPLVSMSEIGKQMGVSRERVRQLRNDALALLRLPGLSLRLRTLSEQDSCRAYRQARQMSDAWMRRQRRLK